MRIAFCAMRSFQLYSQSFFLSLNLLRIINIIAMFNSIIFNEFQRFYNEFIAHIDRYRNIQFMIRKCFFKMFSKLLFALSTRSYLYVILMSLLFDIKIVVIAIVFVIVVDESLIRTTTTKNKHRFYIEFFFESLITLLMSKCF